MSERATRRTIILVPYLWLAVFFLVPFAIVAKMSLSQVATAIPPYTRSSGWRTGRPAGSPRRASSRSTITPCSPATGSISTPSSPRSASR